MALLNVLMAFNLINGGYGLIIAAAAFVISFIFIVLLATKREVVYIDPDTDYEIAHDKIGWGKKVTLATVGKDGRRFVGWSYDEDGEKRLGKKEIRLWKTTELYAVWEKPMVGVSVDEANAVVEFVYLDADGKEVSKQVCPFAFNVPSELDGKAVAGWALDPEDEPVVTPSENDKSVLTVELYPIGEGWEKKAAEEVVEEVVEEAAEEAPAEVVEEVIEEVVEEAPADYVAVAEEAPAEEEPAAVQEAAPVEPVIVPTYIDGNGNELDIRYSRSFTANVIQGEDNVKEFYSELKNHLLSYKGVKSRISWKFDSYNRGRDQLVKLKIRGKTICMYIALDPNEFDKAKYHHDAMDSKIFEDVPMLVKIKSGLGLRKAKELVDILMAKLEIAVDEKAKTVDYVAEHPYEETDVLVQKGLIKILQADASDVKRAPAIVEAVAEEAPAEVVEEVAEEVVEVAPVIVPTYIDGNGNELDIRYSRSFKANVIQADDTVKEYYSELRNHILSYKGVKGRTSWKFDSFNKGRVQLAKLKLRGKTLSMYLALDPNEFDKAKYHHDETDSKMFEDVPMLVKVKSNLGLRKAKELVDILMAKFEIAADAKFSAVDYVAENPYEETDALIQKGLIKVLQADENDVKKAPAIVEEAPVEEAPAEVVEEVVAEEIVEEVAEEVVEEVAPVIVPTYIDGNGNELDIRYSRSFKANVIQAEDTVKEYYSELRNHILSYKGVKGRTSWKFDSFNKGRVQLAKLKLRGKTLSMYLALDPNEFDKAKYHHDETDSKMFEDVPMLVKVKSNLGLRKAKELVDILMAKFEIAADAKFSAVDYVAENPYEETDALIQKGLIKVLQADENDVKKAPAIVEEAPVEEAPAEVVEEVVAEEIAEEVVEEAVAEEVAEEIVEEVVEEVVEEAQEEVIEEVAEEAPVEEVQEEVAEEVVEEAVEEVAEETAEEVTEYVAEEVVAEDVAEEEPEEAVEEVAEEIVEEAVEEAPAEEAVEEEAAEEVIEEAQEEAVEEVAEEVIEEAAEETVEEVVEEAAEEIAEEVVEEVVEEVAPATTVEEIQYVESVSADEVDDLVEDDVVDSLVEDDVEYISADDTKKSVVNLDTLSKEFNDGDIVDLASLKAKGLVDKKTKSVKVLARGTIDKALTVKANEFSETALKMIVLTGGTAVKTVSKVK